LEILDETFKEAGMKRVLYITQKPHNPVVDGGTQAIASCYFLLSKCKDIALTYAPICTPKHPGNFSEVDHAINLIPLRIEPKVSMKVLLKSVTFPMNVLRYTQSNALFTLQSEDSKKPFDVVICDGFYALSIIPRAWFTAKPVIYRSHNLEYEHWKQRATLEPWYLRWFCQRISRQLYALEQTLVNACSHVLSISHEETRQLSQWNAKTRTWYPRIYSKQSKTEHFSQEKCIGFVGNFEWIPNVDAMKWFIHSIWPIILKKQASATLEIAGKGSEVFNNPSLQIKGIGFVDSLDEFYLRQTIIISPLRYGTGLNMKIVEALSYGKVIVSTSTSIQGFEDKSPFITANASSDFAKCVIEILENDTDRLNREVKISAYVNNVFDDISLLNELEQRING
jgi:glycosyltransferase involved in cell wall biosynthesis